MDTAGTGLERDALRYHLRCDCAGRPQMAAVPPDNSQQQGGGDWGAGMTQIINTYQAVLAAAEQARQAIDTQYSKAKAAWNAERQAWVDELHRGVSGRRRRGRAPLPLGGLA